MNVYEIPLQSIPQQFQISILGVAYIFTVYWCWPISAWMFDLQLASSQAYLLQGRPLVTGADLLEQYGYLGIGCSLVVQTDHETLAMPTFDNLGQTAHLYVVVQ